MKTAVVVALIVGMAFVRSRAGDLIDFQRDIRPILSDACFPCHGPDKAARKAGLRLDLRDDVLKPGKSGAMPVVPGRPDRSELVRRIFTDVLEDRMPPREHTKPLAEAQKQRIQRWIAEGANYPSHWALIPPKRPEIPTGKDAGRSRNPVDRFILAQLEREGLTLSPEALPEVLIRRVTLDLTGLPPTLGQVNAFLADTSPTAYEHYVDRLMATRDYAERRTQDWLDLARFADTRGYADDQTRDIWPFREWVIEAIHRNQPFDQFTIEQLAGDMLPGATLPQRIASAFHRNAPQAKGATYPTEEYRLKGVVDRVNTTGTVWLGLTVGCAECHDHKFDPISQVDYYGLFALFNNIEHSGEGFAQGGPHLSWMPPAAAARKMELSAQTVALRTELAALETKLGGDAAKQDPEVHRLRKMVGTLTQELSALDTLAVAIPVMQERTQPRETFLHVRGDFLTRGDKVMPGVPACFAVSETEQPRNRLEFARWLVNGRNPLVARVVVNRFWQGYFGHGLVRTPSDFGVQGEWPTHSELLDWLACEFMVSGWDMKHLNRLLVTSATYRQSARIPSEMAARDPQNRWLAYLPRLRLPAEQIRDQALAVSGLLRPVHGGRSVFPPQADNYWEDRDLPGKWIVSTGDDLHRKSLYIYWRRMALHPSMELLDAPSRAVCTARRTTANLPTQALVTLNDPLFVEAARAFAGRLLREIPEGDEARLVHAFRLALSRAPEAGERARFLDFLQQRREPALDEHARWTGVATVLLNLDEFLCRP